MYNDWISFSKYVYEITCNELLVSQKKAYLFTMRHYLIFGFLVTTKISQELNLLRSERLFRLLCIPLDELGLFRDCAKTHSFLKRKKKQSWWCEEFILWMIQCRKHLSSIAGLAEKTVMLLKFYPRPWRNNYRSLTAAELQLQPALCVCRKW